MAADVPSSATPGESLPDGHDSGGRSTILVLDDDPGILLLEQRALERAGHRVIPVATVEQAASGLQQNKPDMLVLDYKLDSTETGLDFYRRLCAAGSEVPAILVTGFSDEGRAIEALRAGMLDVVPKVAGYLEYLPEAVARVLKQVLAAKRLADTEAANRAKDHFLAVLSHELRTPLTPVLAAVRIMEAEPGLPESLREPLEMICRNVELEARLIDDLLDLTRVKRAKLEIRRVDVDIHEALRRALQIVENDLNLHQLALHLELCAQRTIVQGDAARLQQIFWNLLKNAVKFTPDGGTITIRTSDLPDGKIRLQVQDTGVGIEPETLPRIFNAFEQGGKEVTRQFGGLGLGLNITRGLVEAHGGTIIGSSEGKDKGATFIMEMAAAPPSAAGGGGAGHTFDQPSGRSDVRVLLVEDNQDTSRMMARLLEHSGYHVVVADCVSSALRSAQTEHFDVIVSDIGLPDGSGIDLMRQLRSEQPLKGIAVSGFGMEEDVQRSLDAGFAEHLTKPVDPRRLAAVIHQLLNPILS